MARRRRKSAFRRSRRGSFYGGFKRRARSTARSAAPAMKLVGAAIYGAIRARTSNALAPVTANIPLGNVADEVGMLAAGWAAKKFAGNKVPLVKDIANAGMMIEAARIGEALATGQLGIGATTTGNGGGSVVIG